MIAGFTGAHDLHDRSRSAGAEAEDCRAHGDGDTGTKLDSDAAIECRAAGRLDQRPQPLDLLIA